MREIDAAYDRGRSDEREQCQDEIERLRAEIERLRTLLLNPTPEMLDAAEKYNREHIVGKWSFADCYRAMTTAALDESRDQKG